MAPRIPSTDEILPAISPDIIHDIAALVTMSVFYGIYFILAVFAIYALLKRRQWTSQVIACVVLAMFGISTFLWASNVSVLVQRLDIVLGSTRGPLAFRLSYANEATEKVRYMDDLMFMILYLIGDAFLAWRIVMLRRRTIWVFGLFSVLWLGIFGSVTGLVGCLIHTNFPSPDDLPHACTNLSNAAWVLSLILNATSTGIIAYVAWTYRRTVGNLLGTARTQVDGVLTTLVVSGVAYLLLGLPRLATFANPTLNPSISRTVYATELIEAMLSQLIVCSPAEQLLTI
ncbi:hypothetical protein EXIGLDRAFT_773162 [Exidia glandulosa HHB12029]|uniref:Family A G protein-coupled receptor-like protein n=1 Tax=Exidia glandulosa HHB12029 TaxID=1314781 RepID=A0A165EY21_EXIGL|nr:hypothetical protein EXIGLDRAFT_773162 [Exidia glandulosa HHB12029]